MLGDDVLEGFEVIILLLASLADFVKQILEALALFTQLMHTGFDFGDVCALVHVRFQSGAELVDLLRAGSWQGRGMSTSPEEPFGPWAAIEPWVLAGAGR